MQPKLFKKSVSERNREIPRNRKIVMEPTFGAVEVNGRPIQIGIVQSLGKRIGRYDFLILSADTTDEEVYDIHHVPAPESAYTVSDKHIDVAILAGSFLPEGVLTFKDEPGSPIYFNGQPLKPIDTQPSQ